MKTIFPTPLCWLVVLTGLLSNNAAGGIVLQDGHILLLSKNALAQVDRSGDVVGGVFLPNLYYLSVALGPSREILVAGTDYRTEPAILKISTNGAVLSSNVPPMEIHKFTTTLDGGFLLGAGTTVFRTDSGFSFLDAFFVPPAPGSAPYITGMSVDQNGYIFVAIKSQNGRTSLIHKMDAQGNVLETLGPFDFIIDGISVDTNGHIFYAANGRDESGFPLPSTIVELDTNGLEIRHFLAPFHVDDLALIHFAPPPRLLISCAGSELTLRWATNSAGFQLQAAQTSPPGNWSIVNTRPAIVGSFFAVTTNAGNSGMMFRLVKSP
jgi:hypothetical protein